MSKGTLAFGFVLLLGLTPAARAGTITIEFDLTESTLSILDNLIKVPPCAAPCSPLQALAEQQAQPRVTALTFPRNSCPGRMLRFAAGWEEGKGHEAQAAQRRTDHPEAA